MFSRLLRFKQQSESFTQFYQYFKLNQTIEPVRPAATEFSRKMATKVSEEFANFDAKISLDAPVTDYVKLMDDKMKADVIMPHGVFNQCWKKISAATREALWKLLFESGAEPQKQQLEKAAELMKLHKEDACFYSASEYNDWIVGVRDELLKRNMLDFWQNVIVQKELGPCWARDSDLFDDPKDPEPAKFYQFADCEAPWLKNKAPSTVASISDLLANSLHNSNEAPKTDKTLRKLSVQNPVEDYKHNVEAQGDIDGDDEDAYKQIFAEAREMVWQLLFGGEKLSTENSQKAADLLEVYKSDACFFCPWDYNDWIPTVRDELLKRKYFDFWQNVIVKKELGLCWARDSDYFDDMEDKRPMEFYKVGDDFIKQQKQ